MTVRKYLQLLKNRKILKNIYLDNTYWDITLNNLTHRAIKTGELLVLYGNYHIRYVMPNSHDISLFPYALSYTLDTIENDFFEEG